MERPTRGPRSLRRFTVRCRRNSAKQLTNTGEVSHVCGVKAVGFGSLLYALELDADLAIGVPSALPRALDAKKRDCRHMFGNVLWRPGSSSLLRAREQFASASQHAHRATAARVAGLPDRGIELRDRARRRRAACATCRARP